MEKIGTKGVWKEKTELGEEHRKELKVSLGADDRQPVIAC
jgi:hypothetical protein